MKIQIRTSDLTEKQVEQEQRCFNAAEVLRKHGFDVEVSLLHTSRKEDYPAAIYVR